MNFPSFVLSGSRRSPRSRRPRRGTALIETALCLTFVLLPITLGGLQFGMVMMTTHALQQIARESARFATVHYTETTFDSSETQGDVTGDVPSLKHFVRQQAAANGIAWADISGATINKTKANPSGDKGGSITVTPVAGQRVSGQPITVTITYPMRQRAFLGALFFQNDAGNRQQKLSLGFFSNDYSASSTNLLE